MIFAVVIGNDRPEDSVFAALVKFSLFTRRINQPVFTHAALFVLIKFVASVS